MMLQSQTENNTISCSSWLQSLVIRSSQSIDVLESNSPILWMACIMLGIPSIEKEGHLILGLRWTWRFIFPSQPLSHSIQDSTYQTVT